MNAQQIAQHPEVYQQLKLALTFPGETIAGVRRAYTDVNKDDWTFDFALTQPDTPRVAHLRKYEATMWLRIGKYEQKGVM